MGTKHPDSIAPAQWRHAAPTVADMARRGWSLAAVCRQCRLEMAVDLRVLIAMQGPDFEPWNRTGRCRRLGCRGVADFRFKARGMSHYKPLTAPDGALRSPR